MFIFVDVNNKTIKMRKEVKHVLDNMPEFYFEDPFNGTEDFDLGKYMISLDIIYDYTSSPNYIDGELESMQTDNIYLEIYVHGLFDEEGEEIKLTKEEEHLIIEAFEDKNL